MTIRDFASAVIVAQFACASTAFVRAAEPAAFADVTPQTTSHGFRAAAVYLNDAGQPFGARFVHEKSGFTLDLIQVQSVPQAFIWVNSFPVSDKGEPHTQEHLLLGKGNVGRAFAASQGMTLTQMNAFTLQWRTCYNFNTKAGLPVFYDEFKLQMTALLHPDYTDEEIRREVRNFGVAVNPATKQLRLEEKGTVYNEMIGSTNNPGSVLFRQLNLDLYGAGHPLSYNSGGSPAGIREMTPEDIRNFHRDHYFLANMGAVASLPKGETLAVQLTNFDRILNQLEPVPSKLKAQRPEDFPAPAPAPTGTIQVVDFPFQNDQQPSFMALAWPASLKLSVRETSLANLFLDSFAGDTSTDVYRLFIDSRTRKLDLGARGVFASVNDDQGFPVTIGFSGVAAGNLNEPKVGEVRALVTAELARIASMPDGSAGLAEFNARVRSLLVEQRRQLSKLIDSPPGFGGRTTGPVWMEHLDRLNRASGFRKSVTMKEDLDALDLLLAGSVNIWRDRLRDWHLTGTVPYGIAARPSPALLKQRQQEQLDRTAAEVARLRTKYAVPAADANAGQEAIRRYQRDYDTESARLDTLSAQAGGGKFLDNPPLTLDDSIEFQQTSLKGGVPLVASFFDNMSSARLSLALRLDTVPETDLPLLSLLPVLLTQAGVVENGKPVPFEQMGEMLRKEVLSLDASFRTGSKTDRVELTVSGAGNNLAESRRAVEWMRLVLEHPDWRAENLPRLRDLIAQNIGRLRATMQGSEESWVMNPVQSYWKQQDPLYLTTTSFLTRAWNADRLRWMLADIPDRSAVAAALSKLGESGGDRAQLKKLAEGMQPKGLADDLSQILADLPDGSLAGDWRYVCSRLGADILAGPENTLARLDALRASLLNTGNARAWTVGSRANLGQLQPALQLLAGALREAHPVKVKYAAARRIDARLREHQGDAATPRFVGLFNPNMTGGVMATIVPFTSYNDTGREAQLDFLAEQLFSGAGAHGVFTKTIGAGFAYSNGIRGSLRDGTAGYYAERMPEVPQTLHFVIDLVKKGPRDPKLSEYAVSLAFGESYASASYEARADVLAGDLADGLTADKVKRFRSGILALRREPGLADELFRRIDSAYGKVLPGYGPKAKDVPGAVYYIIGNDKQFSAMDADVQTREDEHLYKLYPRDYWLVN